MSINNSITKILIEKLKLITIKIFMKNYALGIDLGTTFSKVSVKIGYDHSDIVADPTSNKNIPSIVNFSKNESGITISVGNFAKNKQIYYPKSTIYDTKRMLGKPFNDESIQTMIPKWPFKIEQNETGEILVCIDEIDQKMPPYQITGELLKYLAKLGNSRLSPELRTNNVVITVPANFHNEQRAETLKAAEYAGLNVLMLLNEPTAAGISYGYNKQHPGAENVFVFDFGGGTLDVSLLHINDSEITVIATDGDLFLGGRDFDERTAEYLLKQQTFSKYSTSNSKRLNFIQKVNNAKKILSQQNEAIIQYKDDTKQPQEYKLTLSLFEEINRDLIDRILIPVKRLLKTAKIEKEKINSVILVGGSSNMQFVSRKLTEFFGKSPFNGVDAQEAVADGAGIIAAKLINDEKLPKKIKDVEFHEICSHSIGTSNSVNGIMEIAIPKGNPIPTQKVVKQFSTVFYKQEEFFVDVLEGESELANENICIGSFIIHNLPQTENQLNFDVSFSLDLNGILSVEAKLINGELEGGTKIDIKKVKNNSSENKIELIEVNQSFADFEIFMRNVKRFIKFNKNKLLNYFSYEELDRILSEVGYKIKNVNEEWIEKDQLSDCYLKKFARYFDDNNPIPDFFNCFNYII